MLLSQQVSLRFLCRRDACFIPVSYTHLDVYKRQPLECRLYIDMPKHNVISARLMYCYGNEEYNAFSTSALSTSRNFNDEIATRLVFTRYMTRIDAVEGIAYIEHSQDAMYEFLNQGLKELGNTCEVFATDKFKKLQIKESVNISMGVRIESDLLEINFDTYDFPVNELQEVLASYRMNKKYYRMKNGSFVNIEDSALQELSAILDGMHVSEKEISSGVIKVPKYRSLYIDNSLKDSDMIKVDRDSSFKDIIRGIRNVKEMCIRDSLYTSRVYGNPRFSLQYPCASAQTIDMTASISGVASSRTSYGMRRTSISGFRAVFLAPCSSGLSIGQPIPPVLRERISFAATAVKFHVSENHASLSYPASLLPSMVS